MKRGRSTGKPTKAQAARFEKIKRLGCAACLSRKMHLPCGSTEAHHLLSGGIRRGHDESIPLGRWHHRGIPFTGWTTHEMEREFGPSLRLASKRFHEEFGSDDELLARVNKLIGVAVD
jgi:hypothetical protein